MGSIKDYFSFVLTYGYQRDDQSIRVFIAAVSPICPILADTPCLSKNPDEFFSYLPYPCGYGRYPQTTITLDTNSTGD
jgi:hypothetical protein